MRLIDADEAIINFGFEWDDIPPTIEEFVRFLRKQPTVDAVPVTRCKDCKYRTEFGNCGHLRQHGILPVAYPYDFCSYGEPKET